MAKKPLILDEATPGGQLDIFPVELNPSVDRIGTQGIEFTNSSTYVTERLGRVLRSSYPFASQAVTYTGSGEVSFIEFFNSATQITANRIIRVDISYSSGTPTSEVWRIYGTDGTTVLDTTTLTYSYTGVNLTNVGIT